MVYLDYAANTPVDKEVLDVYYETSLKYYGNPNSSHKLGMNAFKIIDDSTKKIAELLNVLPEEIIYTSGATESNNLAIKGICERYKNFGKHIILSSLEHNSIIASSTAMQELGFEVELLPVNKEGLIDINTLKSMLRDDTILVSVCAVDSEIGLVQPIEEIKEILNTREHTFFHCDATQAIGKINVDLSGIDLVTIAPHKFYGINGIGILIKNKNVSLKPIINGGKSTTIFRSGTPVTASIVSTSFALNKALINLNNRYNYVLDLNKEVTEFLKKYDFIHINNTNKSIPFTINFSIKNISSKEFVNMLNERDIYVSAKTSCCPLETPSKLVYALTKDKKLASTSIRISLSHMTTLEEIRMFENVFENCIKELEVHGKI